MEETLQALVAKVDRLTRMVETTHCFIREKWKKSAENKVAYGRKKKREYAAQVLAREFKIRNPDRLVLELTQGDVRPVTDDYYKKHKAAVILHLENDKIYDLVTHLVQFWCNSHWELPLYKYGSGNKFSCFAGWRNTNVDGRERPRSRYDANVGDVCLSSHNRIYTTRCRWDAKRVECFGNLKCWRIIRFLLHRVIVKMKLDFESEDGVSELWKGLQIGPKSLVVIAMLDEGYAFSEKDRDRFELHKEMMYRLYEFNKDTFHRKMGRIMPVLVALSSAFQRGLVSPESHKN